MANFLSGLFSATGGSLVDAVGNALDKLITSDEERKSLDNELSKASMQYDIDMKKLSVQETTAYLADVGSARENQSRVQESEHASWLSKNVQPMLAVGILALTFFMCVFQPIVDGISGGWWTGIQRDRGRRFSLIVDAVSASSWTMGVARR